MYLFETTSEYIMHEECPKCSSPNAYYELEEDSIVLRCVCGLHKYIKQVVDGMTIENRLDKRSMTIPKKGSKLALALDVIISAYPNSVTTEVIVSNTQEPINDTGSRLSVLYSRQLIDRLENGRGFVGGSSWVLSEAGAQLILGEGHAGLSRKGG